MDNENYTTEVQKSLAEAQKVAINRKHQEIGINELFKVLVQPGEIARTGSSKITSTFVRSSLNLTVTPVSFWL